MSYNDKQRGFVLPTRTGTAMGGANERQMLDAVGGSGGYRKQFRMNPDGSTTMLTTKNGMPQFTTSTAKQSGWIDPSYTWLGMDSGALQGSLNANTTYTRTKKTSVVQPGYRADFVHWIDGSLEGTQAADNSSTDAAGADDNLLRVCPASMFTGRMRLYVQSVYGRLTSATDPLGKNVTNPAPIISASEVGPVLTIDGVMVDTSSGIYFDKDNVEHYLVCITTARAYKLKRTVNVARLVELILNPEADSARKYKAEAYILAHSVPEQDKYVTLSLPTRPAGAFGYGWHFNWMGTECSMVEVQPATGNTTFGNLSMHHRIAVTLSGGTISTMYSAGSSVLWNNKRHFQVIAYPTLDGFRKIGLKFPPSDSSGAAAPFYVFHRRNQGAAFPGSSTEVLCTFSAAATTKPKRIQRREPPYYNPGSGWTLGEDAIDYSVIPVAHSAVDVTFAAGTDSMTFSNWSSSASSIKTSVPYTTTKDVSAVGWYNPGMYFPSGDLMTGRPSTISGMTTTDFGYGLLPVYGGNGAIEPESSFDKVHVEFTGVEAPANADSAFPMEWTIESTTDAINDETKSIIVVPYNDAEAVIMYQVRRHAEHKSGGSTLNQGQGFEKGIGLCNLNGGSAYALLTTYHIWVNLVNYAGAVSTVDRDEVTNYTPEQKLCGSFGTTPAITLPDANLFFNSYHDVVPTYIGVRSSSGGSCFSENLIVDIDNNPGNFHGKWFSYVGWA